MRMRRHAGVHSFQWQSRPGGSIGGQAAGIPARIVMPTSAPVKRRAVEGYGDRGALRADA